MFVGIPGLFVACGAFLLKEPPRIDFRSNDNKEKNFKDVFSHIKDHKESLIPMFAGLIFMALIFYSFT